GRAASATDREETEEGGLSHRQRGNRGGQPHPPTERKQRRAASATDREETEEGSLT
ncbi:hypothetical protein NDU88_013008, partial [Pleurodeles waltl]